MSILKLENVSKRFGDTDVVHDLSLEIPPGTIYGFLGPNGAGKTTTIRMICGILEPSRGRIIIDGIDLAHDPLAAKKITGYIPDSPYLYPKLTGREYLDLIADLYTLSDYDSRLVDLVDRFDLSEHIDDFIESYSFGMRQKISIIGALLPSPRLVVVDEPLIGLDPPAARCVKDVFLETIESGSSVFMSTHLLEIAEAICDEAAILDRGDLIASGTMEHLLQHEQKNERLETVFLELLSERREAGTEERSRWERLAEAARRGSRH